jgi:hypothetical protein
MCHINRSYLARMAIYFDTAKICVNSFPLEVRMRKKYIYIYIYIYIYVYIYIYINGSGSRNLSNYTIIIYFKGL